MDDNKEYENGYPDQEELGLYNPEEEDRFKFEGFPERLREYRLKNGYKTATDFAKAAKLSKASYISYEKGTRTPSSEILATIAKSLNVSTDYLLGLKTHKEDVNKVIKRLISSVLDKDEEIDDITENYVGIHGNKFRGVYLLSRADTEKIIAQTQKAMLTNLRMMISAAKFKDIMESREEQANIILASAMEQLGIDNDDVKKSLYDMRRFKQDATAFDCIVFRYFTGINFSNPSGPRIWMASGMHMIEGEGETCLQLYTDPDIEKLRKSLTDEERKAYNYEPERIAFLDRYIAQKLDLKYEKTLDEGGFAWMKNTFFEHDSIYYSNMYEEMENRNGEDYQEYRFGETTRENNKEEIQKVDWTIFGVSEELFEKEGEE